MIERIKNWLIKKLGGHTYAEMRGYVDYYVSQNIRFSDEAIRNKRDAKEWYQRATKAEARVEEYEKLDARLRRLVHLRAEIREAMEHVRWSQMHEDELERYIKSKLSVKMAAGVLEQVGVSCMEDRERHEWVWAIEAYLLRREDMER